MITTVTLNPTLDMTVRVPSLKPGALNLVSEARTDVGGKGINVSLVLRELGLANICTGISFDGNGSQLEEWLEMHGIARRFAVGHGNIRTNIKVFDEEKREMTEINHRGYPVGQAVVDEYYRQLYDCARRSEIVVFSGRVPNGPYEDIYRLSIKHIKKLGCKAVVDAEGVPLKRALMQRPYLIKPNTYELETAFGCKIRSKQDIIGICREKVVARGVSVVCVSMGGEGAVIVDGESAFYAHPLDIDCKSFTGAGDSMVAGLCKGIKEKSGLDGMLRCGVAAASASILREGTLLCRKPDFERLLPLVRVEQI